MIILHLLAPTTAGGLERVVHSLESADERERRHDEVYA